MKENNGSFGRNNEFIVRWLRGSPRGQSIVLVAGALVGLLAAVAFVVDVGRAYYAYQQLLVQTQAAALAGGAVMSNDGETSSEAEATATSYGGASGDANANSSTLTNVKVTATTKCLTSKAAVAMGVPACNAYSIGMNAMTVTETAKVPTTFARVLGFDTWNLSATAMASAKGGFNGPYNVAIIVDTTNSMTQSDSGNCGKERIQCALQGVQVLLSTLSPCPGGLTSCGATTASSVAVPTPASGNETATNVENNPVDEVALFTFPGLAASGTSIGNVQDDIKCPTTNPPITSYNEFFNASNCTGSGKPVPCCTGSGKGTTCATTLNPPVYQIVPFSSDYRTSDTATSLYASSDLVIAAGGGCSAGLGAPGGEGTFYAGVINTAQSALIAQQTVRASAGVQTKNVLILVSDGEANATPTAGMEAPNPAPSKVYSATGQCAQAVAASQAAAAAGTTVYAVAYGAATTGCTTDTGTYSSPVCTMQGIANSPTSSGSYEQNNSNFFTDVTSTKSGCASYARSTGTLNQIFQQIANDLTVSRLIPIGTT
ncbi:MAG: hypothetical protein WCA22_09460 [Candidatus Binatus sp.]